MAKKARKSKAKKAGVKRKTKKTKVSKARKAAAKKVVKTSKTKRKPAAKKAKRKAKPKTLRQRVASAIEVVTDTIRGTDQLRNKMEPPATSETE